MSSKNSCHVSKCPCAFRLIAGQVTQQYKWHALSGDICISFILWMLSLVSSYVGGFLFSHPTRSLFLSFPSPFSQSSTQVCLTQVCHGQVSNCTSSASYKSSSYLQAILEVSRLYSQAHSLEARLWQSEVTAISPLSKRERCLPAFWVTGIAHCLHMAANVGPKSTINLKVNAVEAGCN